MKLDLKLYRGYANENELVVFGHVFESWAPNRYRLDRRGIRHAVSIVHMFRIKPIENLEVTLTFENLEVTTKTLKDGYFRFNIPYKEPLKSGWHTYYVHCKLHTFGIIEKGEILKPHTSKVAIISDIDDTFLISHSRSFIKKLYILLLHNITKRKIFDEVVEHYQQLSNAGQGGNGAFNSFFYVSSSEWNLYEFIDSFVRLHKLPKGILKLKKIKTGISDFLFTGRGSHDHKFQKIKDIIMFYPEIKYVLMGDDSQRDVYIYEKICKTFPANIGAVYIRQTKRRKKTKVGAILKNIESMTVPICYFAHSQEAIAHSKRIGII